MSFSIIKNQLGFLYKLSHLFIHQKLKTGGSQGVALQGAVQGLIFIKISILRLLS